MIKFDILNQVNETLPCLLILKFELLDHILFLLIETWSVRNISSPSICYKRIFSHFSILLFACFLIEVYLTHWFDVSMYVYLYQIFWISLGLVEFSWVGIGSIVCGWVEAVSRGKILGYIRFWWLGQVKCSGVEFG